MIRDALLALGLILVTASQLRIPSVPIGPGEICLLIWVTLTLSRMGDLLRSQLTPALSRLIIFWVLFTISLSLGTMAAFAIGDVHDPSLFNHDALAYPFLAAVSLLSALGPRTNRHLHRIASLIALFSVVYLVIQLANAWEFLSIPEIDPWYWDRLRGFSANPNQLALFCVVMTFLSLHLAEHAIGIGKKSVAILCGGLAMYVGRLTRSDTFALVLATGTPIFVALKLRTWLITFPREFTMRTATAGIALLALPIVVALAASFAGPIEASVQDLAKEMAKGTDRDTEQTAQIRFRSWRLAIDRGVESGMLGLGPGPHIEVPPIIVAARRTAVEPKYVEHPDLNGTPNFEAHNTFLDIFTQGGLIAVLSLAGLIATTFLLTYRARLDALTAMICGLVVMCTFHLIIRHPLFWFAITLCLVAATEIRKPSTVRSRGY